MADMGKNLMLGFMPWFIYLSLAGYGEEMLDAAIIGAMASIVIFNRKALERKIILEWGTLLFFVFLLIVGVIMKHPWYVDNAYWFSTLILALIILVTIIIGKPFTQTYAKESVPEEFWESDLFIMTNKVMSSAWFIGMMAVTIVSALIEGIMSYVLQGMAFSATIGFSMWFPYWYTKRELGGEGVAQNEGISKVKHLQGIGYRELGPISSAETKESNAETSRTLVILHGTAMSMHHWDPTFLTGLAAKFRCVILDLPGIGFSSMAPPPKTVEDMGDALLPFMNEISDKPIVIFGYSLGGFVAQHIACAIPERIEKLILVSSCYGGANAIPPTDETISKLLDQSGDTEERMIRLGSLMFTEGSIAKEIGPKIGDIYTSAAAEKIFTQEETSLLNDIAAGWYTGVGVEEKLMAFEGEALLITGDKDLIVPTENSNLLKSTLLKAEIEVFPNAGHGLLYQYPEEIAKRITQ